MAVTRIKNNQITDSTVVASAKLVDYSITAGKIANNLVYGSDLTISGNLTVNGQTTTIDTVSTVIEDPVIVLASNQTGSPSLDIGFIGERGTANNIAFIWDESATEFATTFTTDLVTNTTVTISSYANFHTNDANIGGNLAVGGNISITGNVTSLNVTGNITGGNLLTPGVVTATGNVTGGNITTAGQVTATGNVSGNNINLSGNIVDTGALTIISGSGNISLSPSGTTTVVATPTGANITGTFNATGNANVGNLDTAGQVSATGNVTGGNLITAGLVSAGTTITATGNITGGNLTTAGLTQTNTLNVTNGANVGTTLGVTGNITGGNLTTAGITSTNSLTASTTITATGNITGGNISAGSGIISTTGNINGGNVNATTGVTSTTVLATGNITGGNLTTAGITSTDSLTASTTITATGNITGGNLITTGVTQTGTLTTTGNALVGGNLIVQGNITYINIDDLRVEDPIIILGTGPNGAPLTVNDGMDRGTFMEYYTTGRGNAFMGWDNSSGNMVIAASASFSGNNVVVYNAYGTLEAGNLYVQSAVSTGNVSGSNLNTAGQVVATGNITGGNVTTAGQVTATGNVTGGNIITAGLINAGTTITATGNITGGNVTTAGQVTATGNVTGGNIITTGNVNSNQGFFSGNVTVAGIFTSTSNIVANNSGIFFGNSVTGNAALFAGVPGFTTLGSNVVAQFSGNVNAYSQINFENINSGTQASTDFILTADNGNDGSNFFNMGITSSTWDGTQPNSLGNALRPNDGYLYADSGNVIIGTTVPLDHVRIVVGGDNNNFVVAEFHDPNTNAVSTTTGTLTIVGGIGATGNIYGANLYTPGLVSATGNVSGGNVNAVALITGANVTATANVTGANVIGTTSGTFGNIVISGSNIDSTAGRITINAADADVDFAVDGDTRANVFYIDAGTGTASFGNATQTTGALVAFNDSTSILMPVGNTAQRPGGVLGMLRFNSIDDNLEVFSGAGWEAVGVPVFTVIADEQFNGNGSQVAFTLGSSQTTASCIVSINGVVQLPTVAYSVSGTTLTFTEAPQSGDVIDVRQITTTTSVTSISNTPGTAILQPDSTLAMINVTGNLIPTANVTFDLGSSTNRWRDGYFSGSSLILGNVVMKNVAGGNSIGFFGPDGTTPATIAASSVDTTTIANGTSSVSVVASGGNIRANVGGSQIAVITNSGVQITGDLSVTGNATLSGNILGDRIQNGTTQIDIQTQNGNANITVGGTSNVAVFSTAGANIAGTLGVTGNITGSYIFGNGSQLTGIDATSIQNGTSNVRVVSSGGNVTTSVGGTANVVVVSTAGANVTGNLSATSNVIVGSAGNTQIYMFGANTHIDNNNAAGNVTIRANVGGAGVVEVFKVLGTGGARIDGNFGGTANITAFANIVGQNVVANSAVTAVTVTATGNVSGANLIVTGNIVDTGALGITTSSNGNITLDPNGTGVIIVNKDIVNGQANGVGNIGSATTYFNTVFAKATSAQYADLAEKYVADAEYAPGTVVVFGGDKEVTVSSNDADRAVAGVVSTNPSYIMNGGLQAEHVATVALTGRVPCRVTGTIKKGDLMVSAGYGMARAEADPRVGTVIGKALENHEGTEGVIEVVVGRF